MCVFVCVCVCLRVPACPRVRARMSVWAPAFAARRQHECVHGLVEARQLRKRDQPRQEDLKCASATIVRVHVCARGRAGRQAGACMRSCAAASARMGVCPECVCARARLRGHRRFLSAHTNVRSGEPNQMGRRGTGPSRARMAHRGVLGAGGAVGSVGATVCGSWADVRSVSFRYRSRNRCRGKQQQTAAGCGACVSGRMCKARRRPSR